MLREIEHRGGDARVPGRKILLGKFPDGGTITEVRWRVHIFVRYLVREILLPIETALINVSIERQIKPRLMNMTAYDRNHRTDLLHLALFEFAPSPLGQTSPEDVRYF